MGNTDHKITKSDNLDDIEDLYQPIIQDGIEHMKWTSIKQGWVYQGQWKDGLPSGTGQWKFDEGWTIKGEFVNGYPYGQVVQTSPEGIYFGSVYHFLPHGLGTHIDDNGNVYHGQFCLGKKHGKGMLTPSIGQTKDGVWIEDQLQSSVCGTTTYDLSCVVCQSNNRNVLFLPCKHLVCCVKCSKQVAMCPICRGTIYNTITDVVIS